MADPVDDLVDELVVTGRVAQRSVIVLAARTLRVASATPAVAPAAIAGHTRGPQSLLRLDRP
jgi:hypothetical protein